MLQRRWPLKCIADICISKGLRGISEDVSRYRAHLTVAHQSPPYIFHKVLVCVKRNATESVSGAIIAASLPRSMAILLKLILKLLKQCNSCMGLTDIAIESRFAVITALLINSTRTTVLPRADT